MDAISYISTFSRFGKPVRDLSRISALLSAVGSPQEGLRFIHIAGTNGKGSIAQMLSEVLVSAGYRTGLFTSPYIITFYDRIRINNENIHKEELDALLEELSPVLEAFPRRDELTQFEVTQAAAFVWFLRQGCDAVVLEAGLGGLLDSTNVIKAPLCSVIGSIGLDHTAILGGTLEEIAYQKAGIIKEGCPCVLSAGAPEEALRVFREQAALKRSELVIPDISACTVTRSDITGSEFTYLGKRYETAMAGLHQVSNALTVIEALRLTAPALPVPEEDIARGIARARLFGRVEILSRSPLTILDGSHNPDGTRALASFLQGLGGSTVRAVIGMHSDKNAAEAVSNLVPYVTEFYPVSGFSDRDYPADSLADIIRSAGGAAVLSDAPIPDLIQSLRAAHPNDTVLICGSLYLVSYIKDRSAF
ncbi:MAG: bifunctional folylpolyglutamate synthase/dihydrofolate synthase [Ruminococcus sp.]|nr:bifunctional folylpolyglutamate synthase/dihydrofolate synthase [Ruminococcus sp.]